MFLVINGTEKIECTKAEKGNDYINLYDESNSVFRTLKGIPDLINFRLRAASSQSHHSMKLHRFNWQ